MPEGDQRAGDPPGAAAELEDAAARIDRGVDQFVLAVRVRELVQLDGAAVRRVRSWPGTTLSDSHAPYDPPAGGASASLSVPAESI